MMSRQWVMLICMGAVVGLWCAAPAVAQTPGELYTWDWGYGDATGPNVEGWAIDGGNASVNNAIDGQLTVAEGDDLGFNVRDSWNRIRESSNPQDLGGLDLTGLQSIDYVIGHSGTQTLGGKLFAQVPSGWKEFEISVAPGAPQTFSFPLSLLTADDIPWINTIGVQVWDHSWDGEGPLDWTIEQVSSAGTPLTERYLSPHDTLGDLDGAVVNWDSAAITTGADGTQNGLSTIMNDDSSSAALRWVDVDGGPGAAISWGNGRDGNLAKTWATFPTDLSNYDHVDVRMRVQPGAGADSELGLQFYVQTASGWTFQSPGSTTLPADSLYHVLTFPLSGLNDMDTVMTHGIDLLSHAGDMDIRVDYVRFYSVPEPASVALLGLAGCLLMCGWRKRR